MKHQTEKWSNQPHDQRTESRENPYRNNLYEGMQKKTHHYSLAYRFYTYSNFRVFIMRPNVYYYNYSYYTCWYVVHEFSSFLRELLEK